MAEELQFQVNIPQEVALKYETPREYPSKIANAPPRHMFTLVDGRVMWLPKFVGERILELKPAVGELIQITHVERKEGRAKIQDWEVKRVYAPGQYAETSCPPASAPVAHTQTHTSNGHATTAPQHSNGFPHANGNGHTPVSAATLASSREDVMAESMRTAVRVLVGTKAYAANSGIEFKITERDVISLGCSIFINATKERY